MTRPLGDSAPGPGAFDAAIPGALLHGRFRMLRRLGAGGMGEVWLARAEGPAGFEKLVAIKIIHSFLAEEQHFIEMFLDEARLAARLSHPNIVQIFELGIAHGRYFIVMEHVRGVDLGVLLKRLRQADLLMSLGGCMHVMAGLLAALDHAHRARDADGRPMQLVHRDVSPANLLVGYDSAVVKLVDFGVARAIGQLHSTADGVVKGKFRRMPPEQLAGEQVDARADVYASGLLLYELLTGEMPFAGCSNFDMMKPEIRLRVRPPSRLVPGLDPRLDQIVRRALEPDPRLRLPSARAMLDELAPFLREATGAEVHLEKLLLRLAPPEEPAAVPAATSSSESATRAFREPSTVIVTQEVSGSQVLEASTDATTPAPPPITPAPPPITPAPPPITPARDAEPASAPRPAGGPTARSRRVLSGALIVLGCAAAGALGTMLWRGREASPRETPAVASGRREAPASAPAPPTVPVAVPSTAPSAGPAASAPAPSLAEAPRRPKTHGPPPSDVRPRAGRPVGAARAPAAGGAAAAPAATEWAFLTVRANLPATVVLDGRDVGSVPKVRLKVPAGRHRVRVDCIGAWGRHAGPVRNLDLPPEAEGTIDHECIVVRPDAGAGRAR
jgi:serine/threonine-protein kinase